MRNLRSTAVPAGAAAIVVIAALVVSSFSPGAQSPPNKSEAGSAIEEQTHLIESLNG